MCFFNTPRPVATEDPQSRQVKAAGDAAVAARKDAFGFGQTMLGGLSNTNSTGSVARQMLMGSGN